MRHRDPRQRRSTVAERVDPACRAGSPRATPSGSASTIATSMPRARAPACAASPRRSAPRRSACARRIRALVAERAVGDVAEERRRTARGSELVEPHALLERPRAAPASRRRRRGDRPDRPARGAGTRTPGPRRRGSRAAPEPRRRSRNEPIDTPAIVSAATRAAAARRTSARARRPATPGASTGSPPCAIISVEVAALVAVAAVAVALALAHAVADLGRARHAVACRASTARRASSVGRVLRADRTAGS